MINRVFESQLFEVISPHVSVVRETIPAEIMRQTSFGVVVQSNVNVPLFAQIAGMSFVGTALVWDFMLFVAGYVRVAATRHDVFPLQFE